jgi:hypothetical protein
VSELAELLNVAAKEITIKKGDKEVVLKIRPLDLSDLAELEEFTGTEFHEWSGEKSPFKSLKVMLQVIYLSLKNNEGFDLTPKQVGGLFTMKDMGRAAEVVNSIMEISGVGESAAGNAEGAEDQSQ